MTSEYIDSTFIQKFLHAYSSNQPLRIAFFDIDFTLSSNVSALPELRKKLNELGFVIVFVTTRTEEMAMSKKHYDLSVQSGFSRPVPHLKKREGVYEYEDPFIISPNLIDPDVIIGTTGTQILFLKESGAFMPMSGFQKQFGMSPLGWRSHALEVLSELFPESTLFTLAPFESAENYYKGVANVFPPDYRIQLQFSSLEKKLLFFKEMKKNNLLNTFFYKNPLSQFQIVDDSNEQNGTFNIYLMPKKSGKRRAVQFFLTSALESFQELTKTTIKLSNVETILAGDGMQDLAMLLQGAAGTKSTSVIVGGASVGKMLADTSSMYAGENIQEIKNNLLPLQLEGYYLYPVRVIPEKRIAYTKVIIGDYAFPKTKGPETILAYLSKENTKVSE